MKRTSFLFVIPMLFLVIAVANHRPEVDFVPQVRKEMTRRTPQSVGDRLSAWWSSVRRPLRGKIECVENCEYKRFPNRFEARIQEGEEVVLRFKPKKRDLPLNSRFVTYSDAWNVSFIPQTGGWTQIRISPKVGYGRRDHRQQTNYLRDVLWLTARDPSLSGEGIRLKRVRLRVHYGPVNRLPTWNIPESINISGARGSSSVTITTEDPDNDPLLLYCGGKREYLHLGRATFNLDETTTCVLKEHGVEVLSQEIEVTRNNASPRYVGPVSFELGVNENSIQLEGVDTDGDRLDFNCRAGNIEVCNSNGLVDVSRLERPGRYRLEVTLSDGAGTVSQSIDLVLTNNQAYESSLTLPEGFPWQENLSYEGEVTRPRPEEIWNGRQLNIPASFSGEATAIFDNGELEKSRVTVRVNRLSQSEFPTLNRTLQGPSNRLMLGEESSSFESMKMLDNNGAEMSLPEGVSLGEVNGQIALVVDWTKFEASVNINFWLALSGARSLSFKKFQVNLEPPLGDGVIASFSLSPGEIHEANLDLDDAIRSQVRSIDFNSVSPALAVFGETVDRSFLPGQYILQGQDLRSKLYFVAKNNPGRHELPVTITLRDESTLAAKILVNIEEPRSESVRITLHVAADYRNQATVSTYQILRQWRKARYIFDGNTNLILQDFKALKFFEGVDNFDDGNEEHKRERESLIDQNSGALNIFYFRTVTYEDGSQVGGFAPYPTSNTRQRHYALISSSSDDSTMAHELGHGFGMHHTFESKFNARIALCTRTTDLYGNDTCRDRGVEGHLVLAEPPATEPLSGRAFEGDRIDDTEIDGYGLKHFSGSTCYATGFYYGGETNSFACVEGGVTLGKTNSSLGSQVCRYQSIFDHTAGMRRYGLSCDNGFSEDRSVLLNVMSYWPDQEETGFSEDQKAGMRQYLESTRHSLRKYVVD